jgi:dolichol-phosphate mannosyltransferase
MISLVIPTYEEAEVIETVLQRAGAVLRASGEDFELIVVDDSPGDATAERAQSLSSTLPVRVLRRRGQRGLATAVVDGWRVARGDILGVMDADLQHPPEVLPGLVAALRNSDIDVAGIDVAIGSRHVPGGGSRYWSVTRRAVSWLTAHLAACVLPLTLAGVHDPMSGIFLVRARALSGVELCPLGYKILLEVLGRGHWRGLVEVPYAFSPRRHGSSKLGPRQSAEYLWHLLRLARATGQLRAWLRYAAVGLGGAVIDVALSWLLVRDAGWHPAMALPVAIELALLSNFVWNQAITFRRASSGGLLQPQSLLRTLVRYERVCSTGAVFNFLTTILLLTRGLGLVPSSSIGVLAGGIWNLIFNVPRIWQAWSAPLSAPQANCAHSVGRNRVGSIARKADLGNR